MLYARVAPATLAELQALAESSERSVSAVAREVLELGLEYDRDAVIALLGWCWQIAGYVAAASSSVQDQATAEGFKAAIRRAELALGMRRPDGESLSA